MASCLVPDFPAVMVALEHLKELDKQLKEDGVAFSTEASLHLTEITAAITELEAEGRATHERLEVETIENSKLRNQINNMRERMCQEIMADVAAARASNAEEMEQLQKDLTAVSQLHETTVKWQETLLNQNKSLHPEREQVKAEHEEVIAVLNDKITFKYGLQTQLDRTQEQIEELKTCTAAIKQDQMRLQQNMVLEREAFKVKQDNLSREVDQVEGKIKQQKQAIKRRRRELERVNDKRQETHNHLYKLMLQMAKQESVLGSLTETRCQNEGQLEGETQKHQEMRQQREALKKELCELRESFSVTIQHLKEEIATVEGKIEEGQAAKLLYQDSLAQISEILKHQCDEENDVQAEHLLASQQLERSRQQLEERIATIVQYSKDIKEMDKQLTELLEADTINNRMFERDQEEMNSNMDTECRNISHFEEEKRRLTGLLEGAKRKQEEYVTKMTSDIDSARRRYQELRQEEAALQQRQPRSVDADSLMSHVAQCEVEYRQEEAKYCQEIERCAAEAEVITRSNEEKQRGVEEMDERLKEVEAMWSEEQLRRERVKKQTSDLRKKRNDLQLSIQGLKEKLGSLLQPKEELEAELQEMRQSYMDTLDRQASELRAAETSIYNNTVKLEQVRLENSRMHLRIRQMTEDVGKARGDRDRYWEGARQLRQDARAAMERLQEAWRGDVSLTKDCQSGDEDLLVSMSALRNHLKTRREQLGGVSALLHHQMLDFSRRLGDKMTTARQSVAADL